MKKAFRIITGIIAFAGAGIFFILRIKTHRKLRKIADNGYETAADILFPKGELKSKNLHYGPVLPG